MDPASSAVARSGKSKTPIISCIGFEQNRVPELAHPDPDLGSAFAYACAEHLGDTQLTRALRPVLDTGKIFWMQGVEGVVLVTRVW